MKYVVLIVSLLCLFSCKTDNDSPNDHKITIEGNIVTIDEASPVLSHIVISKVEETSYKSHFTTSGTVKAIPSSYIEVSVPFSGRIDKSYIELGQYVNQGDPLFSLSSSDYFEACHNYFDALREMEQAEKQLKRTQDLYDNHVASTREIEEQSTDFHLKQQHYESAKSALRVFNIDPSQVNLGEPLIVQSPISGKIVTNSIVLGQYVKEDSEPLLTIANLKKVWVSAAVKEKDIPHLNHLQNVSITLASEPNSSIEGLIYHIGDILDEDTRSINVLIECDNAKGNMKPNMYSLVRFTDDPITAIKIPTSAILQQENNTYVFKVNGNLSFLKTPITIAYTEDEFSIVSEGISSGDEIITRGAFYLLDAK